MKPPSFYDILFKKDIRETLTLQQLQDLYQRLRSIPSVSGTSRWPTPAAMAMDLSERLLRPSDRWKPADHLIMLSDKLARLVKGEATTPYLMVSMPPRHGKSLLCSFWFPLWVLSRAPSVHVIMATYSDTFAAFWGRKARNFIIDYGEEIGLELRKDTKASDEWEVTEGGGMLTAGLRGGITGRGTTCMIIDDAIKDEIEAGSEIIRETIWDQWQSTAFPRIEPGGCCVFIGCLTGDTQISLASGAWKAMADIRPGDQVVGWEDGEQVRRRVLNWISQGDDDVFEIRALNARLHANARHPFLVQETDGSTCWVRTDELRPGHLLVRTGAIPGSGVGRLSRKEAWLLGYMFGDGWVTRRDTAQPGYKGRIYPRRGYVTCVAVGACAVENAEVVEAFGTLFGLTPKLTRYGYRRTDVARVGRWFIEQGLEGRAKTKRLPTYLFSEPIHIRISFLRGIFAADGYREKRWGRWSIELSNSELLQDVRHLARSCGYPVTNVYVRTRISRPPHSPEPLESTAYHFSFQPKNRTAAAFSVTRIRSVKPIGRTEVFDMQVEGAETFIADGVVSHNTRWHEDDLLGRLEAESKSGEGLDIDIVNLPAMAEEDDPMGRDVGEPLWPQKRSLTFLEGKKKGMSPYLWGALFQGHPTPEGGGAIKRAWWKHWDVLPDHFDQVIMSWDLAFKDLKKSDYVCGAVWGRKEASFYLLDLVRDRLDAPATMSAFRSLCAKWPQATFKMIEDAANGPAVFQMLRHEIMGICLWPPKGQKRSSKDERISSVAPLIQAGNVYLPHPELCPWVHDFIEEHAAFPHGANDDQVDTTSQALSYLREGAAQFVGAAWDEALVGAGTPTTTHEVMARQFDSWIGKRRKVHERQFNRAIQPQIGASQRRSNW